ncbi:mycofactocin biosynthesis glycosyltransferase MftF [Klenkia sp. LSe6-5]|uniref:Mycofactocin biosynthesis glycosyltransferase MftF n=1 Tax=Klenkia sesuvii TaxID=3103137 RepID=A0ABU8DXY4_9ACTN
MSPPDERLPDGFRVVLDPRTRRRDGGAALLGGSPLRLLRLAPRARALLTGDALTVTDVTTAALAARLLDTGLAHPDLPPVDPADVTVVVPVKDRAGELDRLLRALRADLPDVPLLVVDDGSADPAATARVCAAFGARVLRHATSRGPSAARNAGLAAATTTAVAFVDSDCVPRPGWLGVLAAHLADPRLAVVAPRIVALPAARPGWVGSYEDAVSALDMGPRPAPVAPLTGVSYVPSAALLVRRAALGAGFDEDMQVAEDVDLVWRLAAAGWRVRYEPAAEVAHEHPARTADWLRRRAFYGTGAALLAQRHGSAVAPVVMSPWSAAAWGLALAGGAPGAVGAGVVLAGATARLAPRLAPRPGDPPPTGLAATLVVRGTWSAGRTLARSATRHHWPLVVPLLGVRRVRRVVVAAAVADAVGAWWPHRREVGLLRFAAGRRLEDLAYGAGLWRGALRARSPRALLPARPR